MHRGDWKIRRLKSSSYKELKTEAVKLRNFEDQTLKLFDFENRSSQVLNTKALIL